MAGQQQDAQAKQAVQALQGQMQQLMQQLEQERQKNAQESRKVEIDAFNADTNRLKAISTGMTPEQVQMLVFQTLQQMQGNPDVTPGV